MRLRHALVLALALLLGPAALAQEVIFPGLTGQALRDALAQAYRPSSVPSSDASKDTLYAVIDRVTVNGQAGVRGLYTDYFVPFDCNPNCDPSQDVYNGGSGINQEHVWPRSQGASGLAERDMHHLYPTRVKVNSDRGSLRFGESPDAQTNRWYYLDQERTAPPPEAERDAWSELRMNVLFEPREEKKGDVARAMFYFYTMYGPSGSGQASTSFFEQQKDVLFDWHRMDPPTEEERARSERVAQYQRTVSGRTAINPFAHDPTLVQRAYFPDAGPTVGPVVFVDASATGAADGASWATAFTDLQDALALARENPSAVEEIWVAAGTYTPTAGTDRTASFELVSGVALYGGFAGDETSLAQRDWEANETVLSGDIGVPGEASDNSYHVVIAFDVEDVTIDGFTVREGWADWEDFFDGQGAALLAEGSNLAVENTTFWANRADTKGGAVAAENTTLLLRNCTFRFNSASSGGGLSTSGGTTRIDSSWFMSNQANQGGAIDARGTTVVTSSLIQSNQATGQGGGINFSGDALSVINSQLRANRVVSTSDFEGGGGLAATEAGRILLYNTLFAKNKVETEGVAVGGGAFLHADTVSIVNSTFTENDAYAPPPKGGFGSAIYAGRATIRNSIFWGNRAGELSVTALDISHSIVQGGAQGPRVLDEDPLFESSSSYRLSASSPAVDAGLAAFLPPDTFDLDGDGDTTEPLPLDLDGQPRVQGTEVDLGAYESPFAVASEPEAGLPLRDALAPAFPNPFRSQARLELALAEARAHVAVEAFDVLGRRVAVLHDGPLAAGRHALALDAARWPAGVYLVRASGDGLDLAQRVTLLR